MSEEENSQKKNGKVEKRGRPKRDIDWDVAERCAAHFCTGEEIAAILGVHYNTLIERLQKRGYTNFREWYRLHSANTRRSLRAKALELAIKKDNWKALEHLMKNELGDETTPEIGEVNLVQNNVQINQGVPLEKVGQLLRKDPMMVEVPDAILQQKEEAGGSEDQGG